MDAGRTPSDGPHRTPGRRRRGLLLGVALLAFSLTACIENAPLDSLDPAGPFARQIDGLFWPAFWIATGIFVVVQTAILVAVFAFRDRPGRKEPKQIHGNATLEVIWTLIPALILAVIAVPTVRTVFDLAGCDADAPKIEVIGHQWWFEYRYPEDGIVTANVLVIPEDTEVCLTMTSADVLHNYWVPRLMGKRYLVPGQTTELRIQADDPGEYWGHCAEFCGLSHARMRARVRVLTADDYAAWVADQQRPASEPEPGSLAAQGKEIFLGQACAGCHNIDGVNEVPGAIGPDLTHFADRNVFAGAAFETTDEHLTAWLANPPELKPGSYMPNLGLTADEIDALIAYLRSLD